MLMADSVKNGLIDRLTGRSTSNGPVLTALYLAGYPSPQVALSDLSPINSPTHTCFINSGSLSWGAASGGIATLSASKTLNQYSSGGTFAFLRIRDNGGSAHVLDLSCGLAGSGAEAIFSDLDGTGGATLNALDWKLLLSSAGLAFNDALANALVDCLLGNNAAPNLGGSGSLKVYSGAAPDVNASATGTLLWQASTTTTTWSSASGGTAALAANITATSEAGIGTGNTPGYIRWEKGSYRLQANIGTTGTHFILNSATIDASTSYSITNASISV